MKTIRPTARSGGVVCILAFAGIVAAITQTLVVPLIAELPELLGTSTSNASWVITATLLASLVPLRSIGSSLSAAVIGVVMAQMTTDFGGHALTSAGGFRAAMLIGCGVALAAAVLAVLIPVRASANNKGPLETVPAPPEVTAAKA
ncbi:hypothetical protein ACIOEW_30770 [Streptomyces sp. NPDC087901]|uniref:hypothetical protein n=1 Tax=Streptomyces sp. NPDC087901 TaxID=3365818 RepID=UPI003813ABDB